MSDQEPRFAHSPNPGREKISFEIPHDLMEQLTEFAALAFKNDISLNRSEILRASLILALPIFESNPNLVKYINHTATRGNQKNA